ncbi:DUF6588 family protein [Tenacibaculum xiamenense]|uniref:DUF6588 family protein n=1 Tax=Tenacibaculum xiamenense TaxID=1261553 RepID=UPI003892DA12
MKVLKAISLLTAIFCFSKLQSQELETILLAKDDATKLTKAYLAPSFKGLMFAMNNGWYHTAKVHKKFGFDISIGANAAAVPSQDEIFSIAELGLSNNTTVTNGVTTSPTVAGNESITPAEFQYSTQIEGQNVTANFTMPKGIKEDLPTSAIPAPAIQVGVGLPYKLDAIVRYVPKIGVDNVKVGLFGLGIKKEITEWFGPLDKLPLHVSLLAAYSNMSVDYEIGNVSGDVSTQNASTEFDLNTYTVQAIASLNFPIFNVYGGVGYNAGNVKLNMLGTYTLSYDPAINGAPNVEESITDPISLKTNSGSMNATIGARLSLGFFKLYGSYTLQEYNTLNAGIAFSFR